MELLRRLEDGIEGAMARLFGGVKRPLGSEALASAKGPESHQQIEGGCTNESHVSTG
jgi:hypothetical protein